MQGRNSWIGTKAPGGPAGVEINLLAFEQTLVRGGWDIELLIDEQVLIQDSQSLSDTWHHIFVKTPTYPQPNLNTTVGFYMKMTLQPPPPPTTQTQYQQYLR